MTLDNFLKFFKFETSKFEAKVEGKNFKTYDESTLKISERKVGGKVEMIKDDGSLETVPDGVYEMEDGFKFITKDGLIESIDGEKESPADENKPATDMAEEETAPADEPKESEELKALREQVTALEERVKVLEDNAPAVEEMKAVQGNMNKTVEQLYEAVKVFAKMPVQDSNFAKTPVQNDMKKKFDSDLASILKDIPKSKF